MECPKKTIDLPQATDKLLSHNVVHFAMGGIRTHNITGDTSTDCIRSCTI